MLWLVVVDGVLRWVKVDLEMEIEPNPDYADQEEKESKEGDDDQ